MSLAAWQVDLEVFQGPFDLLLTLILNEEIELREVDIAQIVTSYIDYLERAGELELEAATEFVLLVAALLELKSRLLLPDQEAGLEQPAPQQAAEELLQAMLEYRRYRDLAAMLTKRLDDASAFRYRSAGVPRELRRAQLENTGQAFDPRLLSAALGGLLRSEDRLDLSHMRQTPSIAWRLEQLRALLTERGRFGFDEAVAGCDRLTEAVTLFALLELHKNGEADWHQQTAFGPITVSVPDKRR